MKEKVLGLILTSGVMACSLQPSYAHADSSAIHVFVEDKELSFDQPPFILNGHTLVPIRAIAEALGAQIGWNQSTETVTIRKGDKTINLSIGSSAAQVNDLPVTMDSKAIVLNNRTLLPLRFLSENFGENVSWDGSTNSIHITGPQSGTPPYEQMIKQHMENRDTSFTVPLSNANQNEIDKAIKNVLNQDDYLKCDYTQYELNESIDGNGNGTATITVSYLENHDQLAYVDQQVQQILSSIIDDSMNYFQKEKAVHDYIVSHVAYDTSEAKHSAYDALTTGETVCQGYALLTYKMLTDIGIPAKIITGYANGQLHAWNLVEIDGNWYHLDTTFDDPVPDVKGQVTYNYCNLTDQQIKQDHTWTNDSYYPPAVTDFEQVLKTKLTNDPDRTTFSNDLLLDIDATVPTADNEQALQHILQDAATNGQSQVVVKYRSNSETALTNDLHNAIIGLSVLETISFNSEYSKDVRENGYYTLTIKISHA